MKKINNGILLIFLIIVVGINSKAQDDNRTLLRQVIKENQEAVDAIAMYPTETRKIIFEASEYPEIIAKLNAMQKNSQDAFEKLISSFSKEEQDKIWNLTRYEDLISELAADHKKSEAGINTILINYPDEIHKTALEEGINNYDLLVQIDQMNKSYNSDFELLMSGYPPEAVNAFREIIKLPEVLQILFDHMQYTVVIGDYYKKNPERVLHKTDSLNQVLTQKNAQETEDWQQSMKENPQAQKEYTQAAQEYAQQNGYQPQDSLNPPPQDVTDYYSEPYNWWFGYPSWYPYDYWNPYPYWYDWGFYYGPGRHLVFFGLPSPYFMEWYFYYPEHCYKYPELSNHYYDYYTRHPESLNNNSISHSVNNWRKNNSAIVTNDWDKDNSNRIQRFKEYGQMEMNRNKYNTKHPQQQINQAEYLQKRQNKYPLISADISKQHLNQNDAKTKAEQVNNKQPEEKPQQNNINAQKPNVNKIQQPAYVNPQKNNKISEQRPGNVNIQSQNPKPIKQTENSNQMRNARQYHQNTWNQIEPQRQSKPQQQNYTPPRQQENRQVEQPAKQNIQSSPENRRR